MNKQIIIISILAISGFVASCKKEETEETTATENLKVKILEDFSLNIAQTTYNDLAAKASQLRSQVALFTSDQTEFNLTQCKQGWRDCRSAWEQSESFLFGPVSSDNIDPRIDTWPVNYNDLDSVLNSSAIYTSGYVDSLEDALKGFHPIEYLLFGTAGNKSAAQFTSRELDFLNALVVNLETLTAHVASRWNPASNGNYTTNFNTAGQSGSSYTTRRAAYEEIVNAMIGICSEVADGKMGEPFALQDPSLEESPFALNSNTDFTNNIRGVKNVYLGTYLSDGRGLEDLVRENNLSLDGRVKQKIENAIAALNAITAPFGQAIITQPVQVQNAIDAIEELKTILEIELLPYVQQHAE
jgi:putative iron-regulated protein